MVQRKDKAAHSCQQGRLSGGSATWTESSRVANEGEEGGKGVSERECCEQRLGDGTPKVYLGTIGGPTRESWSPC